MDQRDFRRLSSLLFDFMMYLEEVSLTFNVVSNKKYVSMLYEITEFLKSFVDDLLRKNV